MSQLTASHWDTTCAEIRDMTPEQRREELRTGFRIIAGHIVRMAAVLRVMEEKGEQFDRKELPYLNELRAIAYGQLLPEAFCRFVEREHVLRAVRRLPPTEQKRLAAGAHVELLVVMPDGTFSELKPDPLDLTPAQVRQVFDGDHMRDITAQRPVIHQQIAERQVKTPDRVGELKIDKELGGVFCGRKFIPLADLDAAVRALRK